VSSIPPEVSAEVLAAAAEVERHLATLTAAYRLLTVTKTDHEAINDMTAWLLANKGTEDLALMLTVALRAAARAADTDLAFHALRGHGSSPASSLADHLAECRSARAAIVVDGSADEIIARLVAEGWTLDEGAELTHGKRIRTIHPPAPEAQP
jgi:hypothetical protein